MNKIKYLIFIFIIFSLFTAFAKEETPQNKFDVNIQYSQTSGFIPAIDLLWHYNDKFFSSLYASYYISAEKKSLEKYENSKDAFFSKQFVLGSEIFGFYPAKKPALFALSLGFEYKRIKNEEFGFFEMSENSNVTFDETTLMDMLSPFLKFRIDKYSEHINNRFLFVFYPTYCLLLEQNVLFKPLTERGHKGNSSKWQVPAIETADEIFFNLQKFGGILLDGNFSLWQAEYESVVLEKASGEYRYGKAEVKQTVLEYSLSMSYIIPFEIIGMMRPRIGIGLSGSTEFRENGGVKSTHKDIGYLLVFGFYY